MKRAYESYKPHGKTLDIIVKADEIIKEYMAKGYVLTLRQLYYQFVARDLFENNQKNYDKLGKIITNARRGGYIDWDAIVDRTRSLKGWSGYSNISEYLKIVGHQYKKNLWERQDVYIEVFFEKDALAGIFEEACRYYRVPFFSCRGYVSDSEMHVAAERFIDNCDKDCYVLHFGDHDPSGTDMSRDISDRLMLFNARHVTIKRMALNYDQVLEYNPPPNFAKITDSRFKTYQEMYGDYSWELDALSPEVISELIQDEICDLIDTSKFEEDLDREEQEIEEVLSIVDKIKGDK